MPSIAAVEAPLPAENRPVLIIGLLTAACP
jgi:hypothetical protein